MGGLGWWVLLPGLSAHRSRNYRRTSLDRVGVGAIGAQLLGRSAALGVDFNSVISPQSHRVGPMYSTVYR